MGRQLTRRALLAALPPALAAWPAARALGGGDTHSERMEAGGPGKAAEHDQGSHAAHSIEPVELDGEDGALHPPPPVGGPREYELVAEESQVEIAKDVAFAAWTYNRAVPGPVIRVTEGEQLVVRFTNAGTHGHTIHFHGAHPTRMDGSFAPVEPGGYARYEFVAQPAGMHVYHCHVPPLAEHIARGLYGAFIVDPREPRVEAHEFSLLLSGFDLNDDGRNELYAFNGRPYYYASNPITVIRDRPVRIYLANMTEYDPVGSFHLHAAMFRLYRTGTARDPELTDTVTLAQGERCILEPEFRQNGLYMFHPHQSAMADRGASGWFNVADDEDQAARQAAALSSGRYAEGFSSCEPCIGTLGAKAVTTY